MKILVHTPISNRAWCLPEFWQGLCAQDVSAFKDIELFMRFDVNDSQDETLSMVRRRMNVPLPDDTQVFKGVQVIEHSWPHIPLSDHQWNEERYTRMVKMRNMAFETANDIGADFVFSIDSDVILRDPDTLAHLINSYQPIIAGIFRTTWGHPESLPLPNVWERGQNEMSHDFLNGVHKSDRHVRVGGLGACTFIRRDVWKAGVNYNPIYNLPSNYRGEDRNFCIRAAVAGFDLTACAHKQITHLEKNLKEITR